MDVLGLRGEGSFQDFLDIRLVQALVHPVGTHLARLDGMVANRVVAGKLLVIGATITREQPVLVMIDIRRLRVLGLDEIRDAINQDILGQAVQVDNAGMLDPAIPPPVIHVGGEFLVFAPHEFGEQVLDALILGKGHVGAVVEHKAGCLMLITDRVSKGIGILVVDVRDDPFRPQAIGCPVTGHPGS